MPFFALKEATGRVRLPEPCWVTGCISPRIPVDAPWMTVEPPGPLGWCSFESTPRSWKFDEPWEAMTKSLHSLDDLKDLERSWKSQGLKISQNSCLICSSPGDHSPTDHPGPPDGEMKRFQHSLSAWLPAMNEIPSLWRTPRSLSSPLRHSSPAKVESQKDSTHLYASVICLSNRILV